MINENRNGNIPTEELCLYLNELLLLVNYSLQRETLLTNEMFKWGYNNLLCLPEQAVGEYRSGNFDNCGLFPLTVIFETKEKTKIVWEPNLMMAKCPHFCICE